MELEKKLELIVTESRMVFTSNFGVEENGSHQLECADIQLGGESVLGTYWQYANHSWYGLHAL